MTLQLSKVSRHGMQLLQENEQLRGARDTLCRELEVLESTKKIMASCSRGRHKVRLPGPHQGCLAQKAGGNPRGPAVRANTARQGRAKLEPSHEGGSSEGMGPSLVGLWAAGPSSSVS